MSSPAVDTHAPTPEGKNSAEEDLYKSETPFPLPKDSELSLSSSLAALGKVFSLFRSNMSQFIGSQTRDEWSQQTMARGLGVDDNNELLARFSKLFDNGTSLENFYKTISKTLAQFFAANPDFIQSSESGSGMTIPSCLSDLAGDKIKMMLERVGKYVELELQRVSMTILMLYEEEESNLLMREKRIRGMKKFMLRDRYSKMDLQLQIKWLEGYRKDLLEASSYLRVPASFISSSPQAAEDFLQEYLKQHADKKDFVYCLFEDRLIDCLINELFSEYKTTALNSLLSHARSQPSIVYLQDLSFSVDRYMTTTFVKGSNYISGKRATSHNTRKQVSINLMEVIAAYESDPNRHSLLKYSGNQSFDNLTVSKYTREILFQAFTTNTPQLLIIMDNLFDAFIDEVDNTDNLVYDNPYNTGMRLLRYLTSNKPEALASSRFEGSLSSQGAYFGLNPASIITSSMAARVDKDNFVNAVLTKFDSTASNIDALYYQMQSHLDKPFVHQSRFLQFFDGDDLDKLIVFSDERFKLKDRSNPNHTYLDDINNLSGSEVVRIRKIPDRFKDNPIWKSSPQKELDEIIIHPEISTVLQSLMVNSFEFMRERLDIYVQKRSKEAQDKIGNGIAGLSAANPEFGSKIFGSTFGLLTLNSRNYLLRTLSCLNYLTSVRLKLLKREEAILSLESRFDDIEALRYNNVRGFMRKKKPETSFTYDDSRLEQNVSREGRVYSARKYSMDNVPFNPVSMAVLGVGHPKEEFELVVNDEGAVNPEFSSQEKGVSEEKNSMANKSLAAGNRPTIQSQAMSARVPSINQFSKAMENSEVKPLERLLSFKTKLKDTIFDDCIFTNLTGDFFIPDAGIHAGLNLQYGNSFREASSSEKSDANLYVRVLDHLEQEIIYDQALTDFEKLMEQLKHILSYFVENNLMDYCFNAVKLSENVSGDLQQPNSVPMQHLKLEVKSTSQSVNFEYLVCEVLRHESSFQSVKARLIKEIMKVHKNSTSIESFRRTRKTIERLIEFRPTFDFHAGKIMTETIGEMCNVKSNASAISTKDICKEVQNFIVTVFDHYRNAQEYLKELGKLTSEVYNYQKDAWLKIDVLADIRKKDINLRKGTNRYLDFLDNVDGLAELHDIIEADTKVMIEELLPLHEIDSNTMLDLTVEEHKQQYFKTIQVKYTQSKINASNILGKGVKESTYVHFVRLHMQNRLLNRINFIKGNLRVTMVKNLRKTWRERGDMTLCDKLFYLDDTYDPHNDLREKHLKENYNGIKTLITSLDDEKKPHIYSLHGYLNRQNSSVSIKKKVAFSKTDWKSKVTKLNPIFAAYMFNRFLKGIRETLNELEPMIIASIHLKNQSQVGLSKFGTSSDTILHVLEEILNMEELSSIRNTVVQRLLKVKLVGKMDNEDLQRRMVSLGDSKFIFEYLTMLKELLSNHIQAGCIQWTSYVRQCLNDLARTLPVQTVANSLITSIGVTFEGAPANPVIVSDQDQVLITSIDGNEIIYGSENESIVRRMTLQLLMEGCQDVITDPLADLKVIKREIATRLPSTSISPNTGLHPSFVQGPRKVNFISSNSAGSKTASKGISKKRMSVAIIDMNSAQLVATPELSQLLQGMLRHLQIAQLRNQVVRKNARVQGIIQSLFPFIGVNRSTVHPSLLSDNLNMFFWRSITQKQVTTRQVSELNLINSVKLGATNDMMSKLEKERMEIIAAIGISSSKSDSISKSTQLCFFMAPIELNQQLLRLQKLVRTMDPTYEEESVFPKLEVFELSMNQGIFSQEVNDPEYSGQHSSGLTKLLGGIHQRRRRDKDTLRNASDESITDEIKILGRNYLKVVINYAVEEFHKLIKMETHSKVSKPSQKFSEDGPSGDKQDMGLVINRMSRIKFRMGSFGRLQFEDTDEIEGWLKPLKPSKFFDLYGKNYLFHFAEFCEKRLLLFKTIDLMFKLKKEDTQEAYPPFYILDYLQAGELRLKDHIIEKEAAHSPDPTARLNPEDQTKRIAQKALFNRDHNIRLLDYDNFNIILAELDRYMKAQKKRISNSVAKFLRETQLSSLLNTKPIDESQYRLIDLRLRVELYDLKNKYVNSIADTRKFFDILNSVSSAEAAGRPVADDEIIESQLQRTSAKMQTVVSKLQRSLTLAASDLLQKQDWISREEDSILSKEEYFKVESWIEMTQGRDKQPRIFPNYNIALYNRVSPLAGHVENSTIHNNVVLRELQRELDSRGNKLKLSPFSEVMSGVCGFDSSTKRILTSKMWTIIDSWDKQYDEKSQKALISMGWMIKCIQLIRIATKYRSQESAILKDLNQANPKEDETSSDVMMLLNLNRKLPMVSEMTTQSHAAGKKYFKLLIARLLMNDTLRKQKYRELAMVLEKFKDSSKKEHEGSVKNVEHDHIYNQYVNFCQMAASMEIANESRNRIKNLPKSTQSAPALMTKKEIVDSYLSEAASSSFLFPNFDLLSSNMTLLVAEVVKYVIEDEVVVLNQISRIYARSRLQQMKKIKRIPAPLAELNSAKFSDGLMAKNGKFCVDCRYEDSSLHCQLSRRLHRQSV